MLTFISFLVIDTGLPIYFSIWFVKDAKRVRVMFGSSCDVLSACMLIYMDFSFFGWTRLSRRDVINLILNLLKGR